MSRPSVAKAERFLELLEAYQVFRMNDKHHAARDNLVFELRMYLFQQLHYHNGRLIPSEPTERTQYLSSLSLPQFACLIKDLLETLFPSSNSTEREQLNPERTFARKWLSMLREPDFTAILVDVYYQLESRLLTSATGRATWFDAWQTTYGDITYMIGDILPSSTLSVFSKDALTRTTTIKIGVSRLRRALSERLSPKSKAKTPQISLPTAVSNPVLVSSSLEVPSLVISNEGHSSKSATVDTDKLEPIIEEVIEVSTRPDDSLMSSYGSSASSNSSSISSLDSFIDLGSRSIQFNGSQSSITQSIRRRSHADTLHPHQTIVQYRHSLPSAADKLSTRSVLTTNYSFFSARSNLSLGSSLGLQSSVGTFVSFENEPPSIAALGPYHQMLQERNLLPEPMLQQDWSGRGQHAEYDNNERSIIPLQAERQLGQTRTAIVESVRCKRVRLVRKVIYCTKQSGIKREDALQEVQHLYRVQHSHIVRLVGTYVIGSELAILTYPCAEWNLEQFFKSMATASDIEQCSSSLRQFFTCLAKVLDFMHSFPLKHMDIKPQNLLVRTIQNSKIEQADSYKIYFTDFGISKWYPSLEESDTESWTSFTRTYAAKEVVLQETRGLSADIFSLGCVFVEMLAVHLDAKSMMSRPTETASSSVHWNELRSVRERSDSSLRPYYLAFDHVQKWLSELQMDEPELDAIRAWTMEMLNEEPTKRPTAREIADDPRLPFACLSCSLRTGPEEFEAVDPTPYEKHVRHSNVEVPVAV